MSKSIIISNGILIDPINQYEKKEDLRIENGLIVERGSHLNTQSNDILIDAENCFVSPGLIDMHTHMRDLTQKDKEDISTGSRAAAAGGYTTVVSMANTEPSIDCSANLALYLEKIKQNSIINILPAAAVTKNLEGQVLTNMFELAEQGAIAFSDDGRCIQNLAVLKRAMEYCKLTGKKIISHAEDTNLADLGYIHEGYHSCKLGLAGRPKTAETTAVAREIELVRETGAPYHFTHISCNRSLALIKDAQREGLSVTVDVTPHHLSLSIDNLTNYDSNYKMNPPLRTEEDKYSIHKAITDGTVGAIATDHAPHTMLEKSFPFNEAPVGIIGLETAFSVCYAELVLQKRISLMRLYELLITGPASILGLDTPDLKPNTQANICIINPNEEWYYTPNVIGKSRSFNSPWSNTKLYAKNKYTIYKGEIVYSSTLLSP